MDDRANCHICGEPIAGGDDQVAFLLSPFDSFHHFKHLRCHDATEREACAKIADERAAIWRKDDKGERSPAECVASIIPQVDEDG